MRSANSRAGNAVLAAPPPEGTRQGSEAPAARRWVGLGRRVGAAGVFIPLFLVIAWVGQPYFVLLVNAILVSGIREFHAMMSAKGLHPYRLPGLAAALVLPWAAYLHGGGYADAVLAALLVTLMTLELFRRSGAEAAAHTAVTALGVLSDEFARALYGSRVLRKPV